MVKDKETKKVDLLIAYQVLFTSIYVLSSPYLHAKLQRSILRTS